MTDLKIPKEKRRDMYRAQLDAINTLIRSGYSPMVVESLKSVLNIMEIKWRDDIGEFVEQESAYAKHINSILKTLQPPEEQT